MKERKKVLLWLLIVAVLLAASILTGNHAGQSETIQQTMRDAVLHNENRIDLLGWKAVNPGLISGFVVTAILLIAAAVLRIFWIPRFKYVPGRCQLVLEEVVGLFDRMAKTSSPRMNRFLGAYIFGAGVYIFVGTLFELFGFQAITTNGNGTKVTAVVSNGSQDNIEQMQMNVAQLGFVQSDVMSYAYNGERLFEGFPYADFSTVAALYMEQVQIV